MSTERHLVLVGLMGAGKTTVGRGCAARLGRPFVDTDELVVASSGRLVAEIFASDGEAVFRAIERAAVADACAAPVPTVIACGGGAVLDPDNRRTLRAHAVVVWLDAPASVLAARTRGNADRPLLAGADHATALTRLARLRADAYEAAAHVRVDTADRDVEVVVDAVLDAYSAQEPVA
jgi:shikimate kinase